MNPAVSQNVVPLKSTTVVPRSSAAASTSAIRNPEALVMSISRGAVTTGTPLVRATGNLASGIRAKRRSPS